MTLVVSVRGNDPVQAGGGVDGIDALNGPIGLRRDCLQVRPLRRAAGPRGRLHEAATRGVERSRLSPLIVLAAKSAGEVSVFELVLVFAQDINTGGLGLHHVATHLDAGNAADEDIAALLGTDANCAPASTSCGTSRRGN